MRNQFEFHILLVLSIDTSIHEKRIYMILFSMTSLNVERHSFVTYIYRINQSHL